MMEPAVVDPPSAAQSSPPPEGQRTPLSRQARLFDQSTDVCLWIEPGEGRILACSAAVRRWLGHDPERLVGRPVRQLAVEADLADAAPAWHAIAHGGELIDGDIRVCRIDGGAVHLSASAALVQRAAGEQPVGLSVWRDVSPRRQATALLLDDSRRVQALAYEVSAAETRERERIAGGLHDDIGQLLAVAQLKLGELGRSVAQPGAEPQFDELRGLLAQAVQAIRSATFDLHAPLLQQFGLQAAIESLAQRVRRWGPTRVHIDGRLPAPLPVAEPAQAVLFRVVRELMLNVQKHAAARDAWIRLDTQGGQMRIGVEDDGRGFRAASLPRRPSAAGGWGLVSAEAQMQAIGGRLVVVSCEGRGTQALATLPMNLR